MTAGAAQKINKLPPSIKSDAVVTSGTNSKFEDDQHSVDNMLGSDNTLKLGKKKIVYLTKPSTSTDSQVNFNPKGN
jgi:hypothetical protein